MKIFKETLVVWRHDGTSYSLDGNEFAIGIAREQAMQEPLTKGFAVYRDGERTESITYTALKDLREDIV